MDEDEMYVSLELILQLKDGEELKYLRDARPEYMGYFSIRESELRKIKTVEELIGVLEEGELLHLSDGDSIDIDDFCKFLIEKNGKDFTPDENVEQYLYKDKWGMSGENLIEFWTAYQENQKTKKAFIKKLKKLEHGSAEQLTLTKTYNSFGMEMDDFYEDEVYTVKLS
jgi:hypothetical protein